jgi:WhiB family redox-sensing transcriptional regulator
MPRLRSVGGPHGRITRGHGDEVAAGRWQRFGTCRSVGDALFFSSDAENACVRRSRVRAAKQVCAVCPVLALCRAYALENKEEFGVWGGLSETERREVLLGRRSVEPAEIEVEPWS